MSKQIFVTLGTHPQQFNRLLGEIDRLVSAGKIREKVFAQTGHSDYMPKNFSRKNFLAPDEFEKIFSGASIVITHAGEGNIGLGQNLGKKMVVVPRRKEFSEHTNNHQLELARVVEQKKLGLVAWKIHELGKRLHSIKSFSPARVEKGNIPELLEKFAGENFA